MINIPVCLLQKILENIENAPKIVGAKLVLDGFVYLKSKEANGRSYYRIVDGNVRRSLPPEPSLSSMYIKVKLLL